MHHSSQELAPSFDWIRQHPFAKNHDVPDHLLRDWLVDPSLMQVRPFEYYLKIFLFGIMQRRLMNVPFGKKQQLPLAEIETLFPRWQTKLTMTQLHRRWELHFEPLPLFDFGSDEETRCWMKHGLDLTDG